MLELSGKYIKTGIIIMLQIFKRLYQDMGGMKKDTNKKSKEESWNVWNENTSDGINGNTCILQKRLVRLKS